MKQFTRYLKINFQIIKFNRQWINRNYSSLLVDGDDKYFRGLNSNPLFSPPNNFWKQEFDNNPKMNELLNLKDKWQIEHIHSIFKECAKLPKDSPLKMLFPALTPSKKMMLSMLMSRVKKLDMGYHFGSGNNSTLLLGPKGIGKTVGLRSFTIAISSICPQMCTLFIEFNDNKLKSPSEYLYEEFIRRFPEERLKKHEEYTMTDILLLYKEKNQKLFVILDELDEIYTVNDDFRRKILGDIAVLGSNNIGINYVVACGSSSVLPLLVNRNAIGNPRIKEEFPLVAQCPNLNGTKFPSFHIGSGIPETDEEYENLILALLEENKPHMNIPSYEEIEQIVFTISKNNTNNISEKSIQDFIKTIHEQIKKSGLLSSKLDSEILNRTFFFSGHNPRNMNYFIYYLSEDDIELQKNAMNKLYNFDARSENTKKQYKDLIQALEKKLCENNRNILKKLIHNRNIDYSLVSEIHWQEWKGISKTELELILTQLSSKRKSTNMPELEISDARMLIDRAWFNAPHDLENIYALTPMHLCITQLRYEDEHLKVVDILKNLPNTLSTSAGVIKDLEKIISTGKQSWFWFYQNEIIKQIVQFFST